MWSALLVLGAAIVTFVLLWNRAGPHGVSTEEARRRFAASSSTQAANPTLLRPAAGVYTYRGSGTEHLTLPPKTQSQAARMPGTVTHDAGGCWTFRIDYSSNHWETWHYCARDGGLVELGGETFSRWDFVFAKYDSTSTFHCDPASVIVKAGMRAKEHWRQECRGTSTGTSGVGVSAGPFTFVGEEAVAVGTKKVAAYRFHQERTLTGSQTGTQKADVWFAKSNGLPLRNERDFTVKTDTMFGASTYTERGTFALTSLNPA